MKIILKVEKYLGLSEVPVCWYDFPNSDIYYIANKKECLKGSSGRDKRKNQKDRNSPEFFLGCLKAANRSSNRMHIIC